MPLRAIPARSLASICRMRSSERLNPIARRSSSASPPVNPAATIAIRSNCSWNSGTPSVRFRMGSSDGCAIRHRLAPVAALEVGMHHLPDDGPGPDDRDLDDDVVEVCGA